MIISLLIVFLYTVCMVYQTQTVVFKLCYLDLIQIYFVPNIDTLHNFQILTPYVRTILQH